ncbi:PA14 domain-containing protein [Chitinophaga sancti]|uniref:PA14 domain-containing protein n=1 Tax=Chitinophaga sancti TaxID=1004 RepID=A0A1K1S606_9BACT|nr:PA14 domain-containing protein [Chitinophaga sancti]WQD62237.1 PA14 domain-containing protein [Chitinophaga sancti]WQG92194.1 PA14 domain-containing protein [Chitinophaga sancti]SFW79785.1 Por secretion system C-terminal sorting domain-containing protein [Chitinophaga sancti]
MKTRYLLPLVIMLSVLSTQAQRKPPRVAGSPFTLSAVPDSLFITSENMSNSEKVALQTLQGVIAQTKPEILRDTYGHRALVENAGIKTNTTYYNNFAGLLAHYANRLAGYILCNPKDKSTNAAISLAGVMNAVAIPTDIEQEAISAGLTKLLDVTTHDEAWVLANYGSLFNKNVATYQQSSDDRVYFMGDFSTYSKAFQFWSDTVNGTLASNVYNRMNKGAAYFGWGPSEYNTVEQLSLHSSLILPSDWAPNMSALSQIPPKKDGFQQKPAIKPYEVVPNVHTVCFVITDGDNLQWLLGTSDNTGNWANPNRGHVNLGWTISPSLSEAAPLMYEKYVDNCLTTPDGRNVLIAAPSGRGYFFPGRMPDADLTTECNLLNKYMKQADLRIVNIIDADDSDNDPTPYLKQDNIDALFYYSYGANYRGRNGQIDWYKDKPSIGGRYTLWGTLSSPASLATTLNAASTDINSQDGYSLISVHVWDRSVDDVIDCIKRLNSNVRVVAPDEFVWLIRKNIKGINPGQGNGLRADFYSGYHQDTMKYTLFNQNIDADWANVSPNSQYLGYNNFSVKWSGQIQPLYSETYTFSCYADDGVKLIVNGQTIINDYETQGAYTRTGTIALTAGQKYNIELQYGEGAGDAFCHLSWESTSQSKQIVPAAQLFSRPDTSSGPVSLYQDVNYGGFHAGFNIGAYKLSGLNLKGINNDEVTAVKIAKGYQAVLYLNDDFGGDSVVLTRDTSFLNSWNDKLSSLRVRANGVTTLAGSYTLRNVKSNYYMDVRGGVGGVGNGASLQLWTPTGAANQTFTLKHMGDGIYSITAYHSAKVLDVANSGTADNAYIWQYTDQHASNQQFIAVAADSGYYQFINVLSGKVISIENESTAAEARLVQRADTGQLSSRWQLYKGATVGNGNGLTGNYYNGMNFDTLKFSRIDPTINFDWGEGAAAPGLTIDHTSIRWTGKIEPRYTGTYTFYITSDNGRRLWINNQLVIDKWINDWDIEYSGTIALTAGQQYDFKMEYFEDYGGANAKLSWSSDAQVKEIIPVNQLYTTGLSSIARVAALQPTTANTKVIIYPNPTSNDVHLQFNAQQARVTVFDLVGRQVMAPRVVQSGETLNISALPQGAYLISIDANGKRTTKTIVKK